MSDRIVADARAPQWVQALREEITRRFEQLFAGPWRVKTYRIAQLPDAARFEGAQVFIDDTKRPAFSNGTSWRYMDGSAV